MMKPNRTAELSPLQREILVVLEEAGEENLAALTNTAQRCHGISDEINSMGADLTDLLNRDLLEIAIERDKVSLLWIPLAKDRSLALLADLISLLDWSVPERLWKWNEKRSPRAHALVTATGIAAARQILSKSGYSRSSSQ